MAQVSYGTITITDTNDIERIYMEYAQSSSNSTAPTTGWSENIPAWEQGKYIWQRTVVKKEGVALSSDSYGEPVCLTGSTGSTGATGRGVSSIVTTYCNYGTGTPAASYSGWSTTVPIYDSTKPNYWIKTVITYTTGTPATDTKIYQDNGITSATATAASAKTQAATADGKADTAIGTANTANTNATNALNIATGINQHFWTISTDYATGVPAGSYITDTAIDTFKSNKTGGNLLTRSDGIWIRNGVNTLTSLTGTALTFYNPTDNKAQLVIGANGTLQSGNYVRGTNAKFSDSGTKIDLTYGDIITKYFRLSQGVESLSAGAYIYGTIEAIDGKIGSNNTNYWEIGNYTDYLLQPSAKLIGHGSSFIQLGNSGTWRLATNRIHTGWYESGDSYLHFPTFTNGTVNKRWDYGIHVPTSKDDKFLYIRNASSTTDLSNLISDLEDTQSPKVWEYQFYIDGNGNVHAPGFYIGNSTTPIGGGAGTVAERLTQGYGSTTQPIYFNSNGVPTNTTYQLNAAGAKGVDTSISASSTSTNLPTSQAVAAFVEGKGYITSYTDNKVQTSQANTTKIYLAGTSTAGTSTGTLNFDSNVYLTTTAGTLHATTFEGNLSGTASRATADGDGNTISTTYLKLTGGNVTGAVTFGSSVSADELTVGDLVVNGSASFTNNAQFNTINGVAVGSNPKFTDNNTTYTFANGTNGFTVTPSGGTAQTVTVTPSIANNITGSGTNGYLAKFTGTNTIGNGPALGSDTTKFLNNKGEWAVPAGTGLTSVGASGSGGITISGSPITTSGTITIGLNLSTAINGLGEGTSDANRNDYIVAQYANGGTTTTSYHRRSLAHIFAALSKSDITTALGYTPPTTDTNTHRPIQLDSTEILGNNTTALNLVTGGGMTLTNSSGAITIAHKDTSSQATSTNSGRTYIQSITLDTYGHVTSLSTATESVTDTHYTTHLYAGKSDGNVNAATTNGNTYLMVLDNTTVRDRRKISGSGAAEVTSDSSGNITISSPIAITGVSFANGTITFTKSDGNTIPITTDNFVITQATGATALVRLKANSTTEYEGYSAGGATTAPVYFDSNGHPAAVTSIPWSLIADKPSSYTPSSHTHGNITNGGDITTTATIASGDRLVINDESESKINNSSITFGTSTTTFLTNKGTWATPVGTTYTFDGTYNASSNKAATVSTVTNAINALDGGTIGTPSASKTVTAISQTNGNISVTFGDISITKSQISDFPTSMTPAAHNHSQIVTVGDQRSTATTPNDYANALIFKGLKNKATIGSPSDDTYSYLVGLRGWSDSSGGRSHEIAFNNTGIFVRQESTSTANTWGNWYRIYTTGNKPTASDVGLGNVTNYDSSVAIKSITRSGTTFTYTTVAGGTGTFTQQDNNTWDALSTSQAGYVAKAPNDTSKFLRGDATWAQVSSANLSDIRLTWSSSVSTTDWILAHDTAATGTPLFRAMSPANLKTTMSLNNVENKSSATIRGELTSSNVTAALGYTPVNKAGDTMAGPLKWNDASLPQFSGAPDYLVGIDAFASGGTMKWQSVGNITVGAATKATQDKNGNDITTKYVTIDTDQTITASQKTFTGATRWGTSSKYGAAHYDSTLDALVFSFV